MYNKKLKNYEDILTAINNLYEAWDLDKTNIKDDLLKIQLGFDVKYLDNLKLHAISIFTSCRYLYFEQEMKDIADSYEHYLILHYPRLYKKCKYIKCFSEAEFNYLYRGL